MSKRSDAQTSFLEDSESRPLNSQDNVLRGRFIACISLIIFTVIQIFNPILIRIAYKESAKHGIAFLGSTTVFSTEVLKTLFCCIIILINQRSVKKLFILLYESVTVKKFETLKVCVPAMIFVIQNNLYFFALKRIDATLFSMTCQLRILTNALLTIVILDKRFSCLQWVSLLMSLVGAITVQIGRKSTHEHYSSSAINMGMSDQVAGITAVLIMCLTNAFGGVYLEAVLKNSQDDIFLQNIRLSLVSLPMSAATIFSDYETIQKYGFFSGWNYYVCFIVFIGAFGGIAVSSVIRYADNIKKSFCQALALGGTAFVSIYLGDSEFSFYLLIGVSLVVTSVILYAVSPSKKPKVALFEEKTVQFI